MDKTREPYMQVAVPSGPLKGRPIRLPQDIGTADYPIRGKVDKKNRRTLRFLWDEDKHGPLYLRSQLMRCKRWARVARKYEAHPLDFARAWAYLNEHPIFYNFLGMDEEKPLSEIRQERNLDHESGFDRIHLRVARWCEHGRNCPQERTTRASCKHRKTAVLWMEAGERSWPGDRDPEHPYEPRPGTYSYHDPRLDIYGPTYESCVLQLAYSVWRIYGNDRAKCAESKEEKTDAAATAESAQQD